MIRDGARWLWVVGLGLCGAGAWGCAGAKQVQHFEVVYENPDTGLLERNYYRMTVRGQSFGAVEYKLKAAYMSAVVVDALEGKDIFIPEADLPREMDDKFDQVVQLYYDTALNRASVLSSQAGLEAASTEDYESSLTQIARQVFFMSLSRSDIASMGQMRETDPYVFRKLVFYATAKNINLEQSFGPQIESIVGKVSALAQREKARAKQRSSMVSKAKALTGLLGGPSKLVADMALSFFEQPEEGEAKVPAATTGEVPPG